THEATGIHWSFGQSGSSMAVQRTSASYLPSFQISAESFHPSRTLSHTTRYFPEISFGDGPFVVKLKVPISRAALGLNRFTSRVVSLGLAACSAKLFHILPISDLPLTIGEPGGNAVASAV